MTDELRAALEWAKTLPPMTAEELRAQRLSFVYGNSFRDRGTKEECRIAIELGQLPEGVRE
jgi:hypothetical protein